MLIAPRLALALVGASIVIVAACSDKQEPTSPATTAATQSRSIAGTTDIATSGIKVPEAKPTLTDSVGFTKVKYVESAVYPVAASAIVEGLAMCPVGTTVVSGGYSVLLGAAPAPVVVHSRKFVDGAQYGWSIVVWNKVAGAAAVELLVNAVCVS
jgi:hypothetical protein